MKLAALMSVFCLSAGMTAAQAAEDAAAVGKPAPELNITDTRGNNVKLADYKGSFVVLEWTNLDCPFVKKHYDSGNMQKLQKEYTEKDVIWLIVNSSAAGKQGNMTAEKWDEAMKDKKASQTAVLLDPDGKVGRLYGAKTTPHMYVINPDGTLIYMGAIDDKATAKVEDIATSQNYVKLALDAAMAGKPVEKASTQAYGCSVKY